MADLPRLLIRFPRTVVLLFVVVTAAFGLVARQVRVEGSIESVLPADDPAVRYYADVRAAFGSDDIAVVGVRAPDLFSPATLATIARITDRLAALDGVERVLSITNAVDPAADVFDPPRLLPRIPPSPAEAAALRAKLAAMPLYMHNLVAPDFRGAAINVFFRNLTDAQYADLGIDDRIRALLAAESGPEQFFYTGTGHVKQAAVRLMRLDLARFTPLALGLVLVVLWLSFRRVRAVVLPLVCVLMAVVWTLGVMVLAGKAITIGTFVLPPLLLVIGSEYAMHVVAAYYEHVAARTGHVEAVVRTLRQVAAPVCISALTTAIGFGSLMTNAITAIWDLGIFSVVGLACLTLTSLGFLPAALTTWGAAGRGALPPPSARVERLMTRLGAQAYSGRGAVLGVAGVIALLAFAGIPDIRVDSDFLTYFDRSSDVRRDHEVINEQIVGSNPFYLVVDGGAPGAIKRWETLRRIKDLQSFLTTIPGITTSISLVDYLELLDQGLSRGGEDDLLLDESGNIVAGGAVQSFWENPANLAPVLNLVSASPATFRGVVALDFARANIVVRTNLSGSRQIEAVLDRIRDYIAAHFPAELRVQPTGTLVLLTGTSSDIVSGQIESLAIALAVIFVVMALMFLSARVGLLAIIPNLLAIVLFFGILGWFGILLNLGTSLIATIALGIAVDSSVHYMSRLSRELRGESDQAAAMQRTMRAVGAPVLYTTLALFIGFATFAFSSFVPIRSFGVLSGITLAAAFTANLVVLPALLATTKIITLWDLVGLRLGEDPVRTIPLLGGLRPAQARIVVLMGELRRFAPGATIVKQGELGSEMFVIIRGTTQVWVGDGAERRCVAELRRGDVFGEMALVRHDERSADVVAAEAVEALAVDERFLQRIQRRYPRIAARVFLNLTRILSDRLQRMNEQVIAAALHRAAAVEQ